MPGLHFRSNRGATPTGRSTCGPRSWARHACRSRRCKTTGGQVALYVTERGLTTSAIPAGHRTFAVEFDLLEHNLSIRDSDGEIRTLPLTARPVADFYADYLGLLRSLGLEVRIWPVPVEVETSIRCTEDRTHASYDAESATRLFGC